MAIIFILLLIILNLACAQIIQFVFCAMSQMAVNHWALKSLMTDVLGSTLIISVSESTPLPSISIFSVSKFLLTVRSSGYTY